MRRLEAAGYANAGKTNLHEFAYGVTSQNPHYGTVPNPAAPGRTSGGSSGGTAAAIAAGLVDVGLGTDSGGSIRIPAACCGIAGFKPTYGLVPLDGVFPLAPSFDHAGPMARDVARLRRADAGARAGIRREPIDRAEVSVGVAWVEHADPLRARAASRRPRRVPAVARARRSPSRSATTPAFMHEIAGVHRELFEEHGELYGENLRTKIERCLAVTRRRGRGGDATRGASTSGEALEALEGVDLLLTPTLMFVAPPADIDELAWRERIVRFTYPFNLLGWPALARAVRRRPRTACRRRCRSSAGRATTRSCSRPGSRSRRRSR